MKGMTVSPAEVEALQEEVGELRLALARAGGPLAGLVGKSAAMQEIFARVFAATDRGFPVLITGETGAGKKAVSRALHALSARRQCPLAFRGAEAQHGFPMGSELPAIARSASGGTLVLESVHRAPLGEQESMFRLSEESGFRLVCTSTREPEAAVREGKLLPALRDRSQAIAVPALRSRRDDIPVLAAFFLEEIESREGSGVAAIDPKALEAMYAHEWPGNVRELRNVIRRAHALTAGTLIGLTAIQSVLGGFSARPEGAVEPAPGQEIVPVRVGDSMAEVERRVLQRTLEFAKGNKRKAAEMLELSLKTIYNKVKEYGLERELNRRFRKVPRSDENPLRSGNR